MHPALTKMTMRGRPLDDSDLKRKLLQTGPLVERHLPVLQPLPFVNLHEPRRPWWSRFFK